MCVCVGLYHVCADSRGHQNGASDPLRLQLQAAKSCPTQVLETEFMSSGKEAACVLQFLIFFLDSFGIEYNPKYKQTNHG